MADQGGHFNVYGENGQKLSDLWKDSPRAYYSQLLRVRITSLVLTSQVLLSADFRTT